MKKKFLFLLFSLFIFGFSFSQFPWQRPLKMAWSADGSNFSTPVIFQDSSGVPSVIRWKGDTLACVFQWFRGPMGSPTWDRVAVKFSYDNGQSWTLPVPIVVNGLPQNYQRPFDPTLANIQGDSLRIYFSSSDGMPVGLDSTVNTYSARSADGIHYDFEPLPRVDQINNRVIDPAVIRFYNSWHYAAPIGSPQQGAYHYVSPDGLNFSQVPNIPSDNMHNWTGNYMVNDTNGLLFYGAGPSGIWYNSSSNGGMWNGYVSTNVMGGDPSVVWVPNNNYLMIYVGEMYTTGMEEAENNVKIYPNPAADFLSVPMAEGESYSIYTISGSLVLKGTVTGAAISVKDFSPGVYFLELSGRVFKWVKE